MFMHQGWALKKQKIPSSSPRSLLVISSALFFVLAPGIIVRRRIKGKKRIQKQQVLKNKKKPLVQKKCNKNVKICYIGNWKTKKMQTAHKHKMSRRTNWKYLKKCIVFCDNAVTSVKSDFCKNKINVLLKKNNINQKSILKNLLNYVSTQEMQFISFCSATLKN